MVHGGAFTVGRFRPFQFICRKVQLKPGGFAHTALSQSIFSLGGQYLVCLPSVGASRRISGLERSVSSRLTDYVSLSHLTIPGTSHNTTQTTPAASHRTTASSQKEIPPAKQGLQIAKKQLAGHSSQPSKKITHARKRLLTARKGLKHARRYSKRPRNNSRLSGRHSMGLTLRNSHLSQPHSSHGLTSFTSHSRLPRISQIHFTPHHTSHLTPHTSQFQPAGKNSRQPGKDTSLPGRDLTSQEETPACQESQKKIVQL